MYPSLFAPTDKTIEKAIDIHAPIARVWEVLTKPEEMKRWLAESEIEVSFAPEVGSLMQFEGKWHKLKIRDKGVILAIEPERLFRYSYWSNLSRLPFTPENSVVNEFTLSAAEGGTLLSLSITNLRNETTYGHCNFYWNITLGIIKQLAEKGSL